MTGRPRVRPFAILGMAALLPLAGCLGQAEFRGISIYNLSSEERSIHVAVSDDARTWLNETVRLPAGNGQADFPLSLPHGTYLVHVASGDLEATERVVVSSSVADIGVGVRDTLIQVGTTVVD